MRPQIPDSLERMMEQQTGITVGEHQRELSLYEIGGYNTKGEFIRDAIREKIESQKQELK